MPRRSFAILFLAIVISYACYWRADRSPYSRYLAEALEIIDQNYVEPVDDQKLFDGAMDGMVGRLDDHSGFVSHEEATRFQQSLDQKFGGIGIEMAVDPKTSQLVVTTPVPDTPAYREGLRAGDVILAIDGKPLEAIEPNRRTRAAVDLMRGKEGEYVTLQIAAGRRTAADRVSSRAGAVQVAYVLGDVRQCRQSMGILRGGPRRHRLCADFDIRRKDSRGIYAGHGMDEKHGCKGRSSICATIPAGC